MKHFIVGTAGHVDHGKSTLIKALTGVETDRLPEEQARGLSIDLGFAHLELPGDISAGIVDVPGHERFLKNMLAGVGGYDAGLLVVDAQEGVMPQTREHVEILDLLHTRTGLVVISKCDLVEDEFLELVEEDLRAFLSHTFLAGAPILAVSARSGRGLEELRSALAGMLGGLEPRPTTAPFRLPVDRAFLRPGFGTVVTGSLWSGRLARGDEVEILPLGLRTRVRGLQVHGGVVDEALAGQRVAVNLSGVEPGSVGRGQVLAPPGLMTPTSRLDARLQVLADAPRALKHRAPIRFYSGTSEVLGRVWTLEEHSLAPGKSGLVQVVLDEPVVVQRRDRFVLRDFTASYTVGGGEVLNPAARRHKRNDQTVLQELRRRESGGPEQAVVSLLASTPGGVKNLQGLAQELQMDRGELEPLLQSLVAQNEVARLGKQYAVAPEVEATRRRFLSVLENLQEAALWRVGWRREELLKLVDGKPQLAQAVLADLLEQGQLQERSALIARAGHEARLAPEHQPPCDKALSVLREGAFTPPAWDDVAALAGLDRKAWHVVGAYLVETGTAVKVADDMYFLEEILEEGRRRLREQGSFTPSEARELLQTTRKFVIPLLEYYDATGFTQRAGDARVVRRQ